MKELLRAGCELLAENTSLIRKGFAWDMELMSIVGAVIHTGAGKVADMEVIKECKKILKKHEGVFSVFRSNMEIPVLCKMALSEDPEKYLMNLISTYERLRTSKIFDSEHIALAALTICDESMMDKVNDIALCTKELIKRMSKIHPMLTSDEDTAFAALLVMTGKSLDAIIEETEYCYNALKKKFSFHNNSVQSLSHVLTLMPGTPEAKCERVSAIYDAMLARGITYGKDYELASLGALVIIDAQPEELANEIAEAATYLKSCKGFSDWSMGQKTRLMFAALLAAQAFAPNSVAMDASVLGSSLAIAIAEEVCMMVTMMTVTTMTTSSN